MRGALLAVVLLTAGLAGCIGSDPDPDQNAAEQAASEVLAPAAERALWDDPQHFPHPAFGWPTLTHLPEERPRWWEPIDGQPLPSEIEGFEHVADAGEGNTADGMAVFGRLAVNSDGEIFNITDPEDPKLLGSIDTRVPARQAVMVPFPDGRLYAAFATASGLIPVWNITDPTDPSETTIIEVPNSGHTIAHVPGTPFIYNANAAGPAPVSPLAPTNSTGAVTEIYDLSDPSQPELVSTWENGYGCHMISFHITQERSRAYCAGVTATQIWDIEDPAAPEVVSTTPMPHGVDPAPGAPGPAVISHWAVVNDDATVMAVADESGGGFARACDAHAEAGGQSVSGPLGNVWFYDITDEENPELVGWISPSAGTTVGQQPSACTAHIGRMVPHETLDLLVMSFYAGGVALIDFTDPAHPSIAAHWTGEQPLDAWYYNGYVFVGDRYEGLDVLSLQGGGRG